MAEERVSSRDYIATGAFARPSVSPEQPAQTTPTEQSTRGRHAAQEEEPAFQPTGTFGREAPVTPDPNADFYGAHSEEARNVGAGGQSAEQKNTDPHQGAAAEAPTQPPISQIQDAIVVERASTTPQEVHQGKKQNRFMAAISEILRPLFRRTPNTLRVANTMDLQAPPPPTDTKPVDAEIKPPVKV
jgi:hypothetical protein